MTNLLATISISLTQRKKKNCSNLHHITVKLMSNEIEKT